MTRFWITLQQGVDFVIKNFSRMKGGEIFVPKIPSVKMTDLAQAISPGIDMHEIGIRPGEKLHEKMCPRDDSYRTIEFKDHYVIAPSIVFHDGNINYLSNNLGEDGEPVKQGFSYDSGTNEWFLSVEETQELLRESNQ
jgi:UDP-N-acetylglucosamine 4,6-dehydratase